MIALTLDTDWAPVELVRDAVELIRSRGCKVTVFCTDRLDIEADEIALHPNFTDLTDLETPIRALKEIYPEARGLRSHALFFTERFRPLYEQFDIAYDANAMQYLAAESRVTRIARNTVSIPLFFMDRFHMEMDRDAARRWRLDRLPLARPGLKVFDFHPIHLFLNTPSVAWYERAKPHYHNPEQLRQHVAEGPGARRLLIELLDWIGANHRPTYTLSEIARAYESPLPAPHAPFAGKETSHAGHSARQ